MTKQEYMKFHADLCAKMIEITKKKNADYTGIGDDPFKNFKAVGFYDQSWILIGFFTRMTDKFGRLASFLQKGILLVKDESLEDTLLDLANYCLLLCGYLKSVREAKEISSERTGKSTSRKLR